LKNCESSLIWQQLSDGMKSTFESLPKLEEWCLSIQPYLRNADVIKQVEINSSNSVTWYEILLEKDHRSSLQLKWDYHPKTYIILGLRLGPQELPTNSKYLNYKTKTHLIPPFKAEFEVIWGGRSVEENYHSVALDQRFAYDFAWTINGSTFKNEGKVNGDYYCFGQELVAPGDGIVIVTESELPDNAPGVMDSVHPLGNHVIIDHNNGEFSFLAHLRRNSLRLKTGDRVTRGTFLGECGNSGHSSEAHLHYHLQDTAKPFEGQGMPLFFERIKVKGQIFKIYEPKRGDFISAAED
jgi:hypothetical protein